MQSSARLEMTLLILMLLILTLLILMSDEIQLIQYKTTLDNGAAQLVHYNCCQASSGPVYSVSYARSSDVDLRCRARAGLTGLEPASDFGYFLHRRSTQTRAVR